MQKSFGEWFLECILTTCTFHTIHLSRSAYIKWSGFDGSLKSCNIWCPTKNPSNEVVVAQRLDKSMLMRRSWVWLLSRVRRFHLIECEFCVTMIPRRRRRSASTATFQTCTSRTRASPTTTATTSPTPSVVTSRSIGDSIRGLGDCRLSRLVLSRRRPMSTIQK